MSDATVALLALVLGVIGAIVGSFAYLMGEMRKVGSVANKENEMLEERMTARFNELAQGERAARQELRGEFNNYMQRIETEVRRLTENGVRRVDVEQIEGRLTRNYEKLETKIDGLSRVNTSLSTKLTQLLAARGIRTPMDSNGDGK